MTIDSTKYFCNRGALSARLNLVDTPLRGEYYYDGEHEKYYFGARYYDPFFGMWMSPDPASQFANPYSYGGDPLNYIDPTGMWAIGLGLVVGWNKENGWGFGYGGAVEFFDLGYDFSFKFNQDGSKSLNLGLNTKLDIQTIVYLEVEMGLAFSMNSYTGATLSTHRGVCVGEATACVGVGGGGSLYWDRGGSFMGATVYGEVYASLGFGMGRFSAGYEAGLFGMEGRGMYAGANVGKDGASLYASWAENGGWNYGSGYRFEVGKYEKLSGELGVGKRIDPDDRNLSALADYLEIEGTGKDEFVFIGHGNQKEIGLKSKNGFYYDAIDAETFGELLLKGNYNYKGETNIILYSCSTGKGTENFASRLASYLSKHLGKEIMVTAPKDNLQYNLKGLKCFGTNLFKTLEMKVNNNAGWDSW